MSLSGMEKLQPQINKRKLTKLTRTNVPGRNAYSVAERS